MKNRFITFIFLVGVFIPNFYSQQVSPYGFMPTIPKVLPPTPESASLAKFVESPVSYFTGTPDITIPFYTIDQDGLQIPISISYNSKGIQVGETASNVGLGWALNAGGIITRQVRDFEDEALRGYLRMDWSATFATSPATRSSIYPYELPYIGITYPPVDMEPDLYVISFGGISGKFIFNQSYETVSQSIEDIKIVPNFDGAQVNNFDVYDASGNKYVFVKLDELNDITDMATLHTAGGSTTPDHQDINYPQTWYLSHIVTAKNRQVSFVYTSSLQTTGQDADEKIKYNQKSDDINNADDTKGPKGVTTHWRKHNTRQKRLKEITFPSGSVKFIRESTEREDLEGGHALKGITVENMFGKTIKEYELTYHYTNYTGTNNTIYELSFDNYAKKRLMLSSVTDKTDIQDLKYQFTYDTTALPSRHSTAVDNWGYYNGQNNGPYLSYSQNGHKRLVDTLLTKASTLKRIDYPTGGYTEFEFEQNRVARPPFADLLVMMPNNPGIAKQVHFNSAFASVPNSGITFSQGQYRMPFTILGSHKVSIHPVVRVAEIDCPEQLDSSDCPTGIWIKKNGVKYMKLLNGSDHNTALDPGAYEISVTPASTPDPNDPFELLYSVDLSWVEQIVDDAYEIVAGGQRIKTITKGEGSVVHTVTRYKYLTPGGTSSGRLYCIPSYVQMGIFSTTLNAGMGSALQSGSSPFSSANIAGIGYSIVTEEKIGTENIGKTEYRFTNFYDTGSFYKYPHHVANDMSWARGKLWSTRYFEFHNDQYRLVNSNIGYYTYFGNCSSPVPDPTVLADPEQTGQPDEYAESGPYLTEFMDHDKNRVPLYRFKAYMTPSAYYFNNPESYRVAYFYGGTVNLTKSVVTDYHYDDAGIPLPSMANTTLYGYAQANHHQLVYKTEQTSSGKTLTTNYSYPFDAVMSSQPEVSKLKSRHMVNTLLQTQVRDNSFTHLFGQRTIYKDWGNNILAPEALQTSKELNGYETKILYNRYDAFGNLLELQKKDGLVISYIWGYNNTLPVASVENVDYANIPSNLISAIKSASSLQNPGGMVAALAALRAAPVLSKAMISTCAYIPLNGISHSTDTKNYTTLYEYDSSGRLQRVRDQDNNVLSENTYHYRVAP